MKNDFSIKEALTSKMTGEQEQRRIVEEYMQLNNIPNAVAMARADFAQQKGKEHYSNSILEFIRNYSQILSVTLGVSAFFFNLGSNRVLDRKNLIFCGIAVVAVVLAYLIYKEREQLFKIKPE